MRTPTSTEYAAIDATMALYLTYDAARDHDGRSSGLCYERPAYGDKPATPMHMLAETARAAIAEITETDECFAEQVWTVLMESGVDAEVAVHYVNHELAGVSA